MAAPTPPVYQPPTYDTNAAIASAKSTLDPMYQQQIGQQQANIPLYQQELANTKQALQQQQAQQTDQLNRTAQNLVGKASVGNAARGLFDSSVQQNTEQNINTDKNTQLQALIDTIVNRGNIAQNNFNKELLGVNQAVTGLQNEEKQRINDLATANINQQKAEDLAQYDRLYKAYQDQVAQQQFQDQMNQRAQLAALSRSARIPASLNPAEKNQQLINSILYDANGVPRYNNVADQQNALYRYLKANPNLGAAGYDMNGLWQSWNNLHDMMPKSAPASNSNNSNNGFFGLDTSSLPAYLRSNYQRGVSMDRDLLNWILGRR